MTTANNAGPDPPLAGGLAFGSPEEFAAWISRTPSPQELEEPVTEEAAPQGFMGRLGQAVKDTVKVTAQRTITASRAAFRAGHHPHISTQPVWQQGAYVN